MVVLNGANLCAHLWGVAVRNTPVIIACRSIWEGLRSPSSSATFVG